MGYACSEGKSVGLENVDVTDRRIYAVFGVSAVVLVNIVLSVFDDGIVILKDYNFGPVVPQI